MKIVEKLLTELKPYEKNPRNNANAIEPVAKSIKEFGFKVPIVIDKNNVIISGHTRYKGAELLGLEKVPCIVADDLSPEKIKAFRLADNKVAEFAQWDFNLLADELEELTAFDFDFEMADFGFDCDFLEESKEFEVTEDDSNLENVTAICQAGQIWRLGEHRLMCGDSTKPEDVARLMQGEKADLWLTDPPYNVAYESQDGKTIQNDNMTNEAFRSFLVDAFKTATENLKAGGAFYIWHADSEGVNFRGACQDVGLKIRQCLIWAKNQLVMGRQDYQWKHEPCLYGWKDGATHYFIDDRTQTTILEENKPLKSKEHPTMKPVALFAKQINNSTRKGEIVLDTFGGSGTTIIASEQLNRKARVMELDPHYCDVIISRWEQFTSKKAELIGETNATK